MFLNATKPPFKNRDARRAVAYALDRAGIIHRNNFEGLVTCQLIPPLFPAYKPYCPFTLGGDDNGEWNGPDVATAHDLVRKSGTRGAKVVFGAFDNAIHKTAGRLVVATLRELGYSASLHVVSATDWPGKDWNIAMRAYGADYPAPAAYLASLASCDPDLKVFNLSGYCDAKLDEQIAAALERQVSEPAGAADAWAAIDRRVVDAAAIIPFWNGISQDFVSRRVGNVLVHPATGPLIAQMWVK
jgi:peptide/nickel transport system substrate-binding protein